MNKVLYIMRLLLISFFPPSKLTLYISGTTQKKLEYLAKRRYGDREGRLRKVILDALERKAEGWDRHGQPFIDGVWFELAFLAPIPWLRSVALGKLVKPYLRLMEEKRATE